MGKATSETIIGKQVRTAAIRLSDKSDIRMNRQFIHKNRSGAISPLAGDNKEAAFFIDMISFYDLIEKREDEDSVTTIIFSA